MTNSRDFGYRVYYVPNFVYDFRAWTNYARH